MSHLKHTRALVEAAIYGGQRITPAELPALITAIGANLRSTDSSAPRSEVYEERILENGVRMHRVRVDRGRRPGYVRDMLRH